MHVPAAAAAGTAGAAAVGLFGYNRENFQFDAGLRFQRFTAARGFANAQTAMYREDIQGIAEMTVAKMDTWQMVCTLFLCVCAALSCAGRLGMHGAAPPGWICALYSGNIFTSILFCGLALWLALHASLRAQCAMVSLLTRKVRLPIPSMAQLDQARVFASSYEKQRFGDMLRVPFMRHPENTPDIPPASSEEDEEEPAGKSGQGKASSSSSADFGSTARTTVPSWIRDETVVDKLGGVPAGGTLDKDAHEIPEHFKMMTKAMEDWWMYDVYARISMLYGVMCFLYAVTYYSVGTAMAELRGFWISWSLPLPFVVAQALILRLDILQKNGRKYFPHAEWFGHIAPYLAVCATTLEYRFWYSPSFVDLTWVFVYLAFSGHLAMALRMWDLARPDLEQELDMREEPTRQWWPSSWRVPSAFSKNLWMLAPPKKLEPGQHCLLHEMDDLKKGGARIAACRRRRRAAGDEAVESSRAKTRANPQALLKDCMRMDSKFQYLFSDDVWSVLPERSQRQLHAVYEDYAKVRVEVEKLPEGNGAEANDQEQCMKLAESLAKIEDHIIDVQAKSRAASAQPKGEGAYQRPPAYLKFHMRRLPDLPWQVTRVAIFTVVVQWSFMSAATIAEWQLGPESLLKPPGEPPWIRDQKMRSWTPTKVHLSNNRTFPTDYALFSPRKALPPLAEDKSEHAEHAATPGDGADDSHGDGHASDSHGTGHIAGHAMGHGVTGLEDTDRRRLAEAYSKRPGAALGELLKALPELGRLAEELEARSASAPVREELQEVSSTGAAFMAPNLKARSVSWPPFFEPRHLLCGPAGAAALTPRGFGALVPAGEQVQAHPFALDGLALKGPLVGGTWGAEGLELVTEVGELLHCAGHAPTSEGTWACKAGQGQGSRLPLPTGSRLLAAAVKGPPTRRVGALVMERFPGVVTMLAEDSQGWSPAGEVHLPPHHGRPGLALMEDELIAIMPGGEVHRRHLHTGSRSVHPAPPGADREFRGACGLASGGLARLALSQTARQGGSSWAAELLEAA